MDYRVETASTGWIKGVEIAARATSLDGATFVALQQLCRVGMQSGDEKVIADRIEPSVGNALLAARVAETEVSISRGLHRVMVLRRVPAGGIEILRGTKAARAALASTSSQFEALAATAAAPLPYVSL